VWRKQATISVQEEFVGKSLPSGLEDSLSDNLLERFDTVRSGVRRSADIYINLCNMIEKLTKYNNGLAGEYMRLSSAMDSLAEVSEETYAMDTNEIPLLNEGIKATSKHLSTNRSLLEDEARGWDLGVLEDVKRQRDCLVSVRDMFDRRDRYAKDNIPQLERRIGANENKLAGLRAKPEGQVKPGEVEKVEDAIIKVSLVLHVTCSSTCTERMTRTSNRSWTNTPAAFSSRNAYATSCSSSTARNITSAGYTRTGARRGSSTRSSGRIIGVV